MGARTYHGKVLKLEIPLIPEIMECLRRLSDHNILDPNAPSPVGVVSRLIRYDMSGLERGVVVGWSLSYTLWALVDIQEGADAVAGPMPGSELWCGLCG